MKLYFHRSRIYPRTVLPAYWQYAYSIGNRLILSWLFWELEVPLSPLMLSVFEMIP